MTPILTDYRAHSYSFAQGGLGCITLFAGLIFTLSAIPFWGYRISEAVWFSGLAMIVVAIAWILAFASIRYLDRAVRSHAKVSAHISTSNTFMFMAIALALTAIILLYLALRYMVTA